ncbi:MAG TPA: PLP-dependent aminotransferase family protein, partial [Ktedonobacteraceae bacterium]|nr:PLP-dependent aminotransferase family protein [Ktedonobacteraceae bacterium]
RVEQIFLTAGAQQGISLLTRLLLNPGGQVLTETITYPGILQIIAPYQPELFTIPTNHEAGIDVNTLEQVLRKGARPAFIYMVTDGHNPLGVSLNLTKRKRLVELACQYRIPILEDDPYGFLAYDGASLPPLRAFDEQWVYYIGSCSKILAPSLRVGWIVVPENLIHRLSATKETIDLDTATFAQHTVSTLLESGLFSKHIEMLQKEYKVRRDAMHQALQSEFSVEEVQWRKPTNGLYFWVKFAKTIDTEAFLKMAITDERVAFLPGQSFCATAGTRAAHCARLNFSSNPPERIREGIARFARAVRCFNHWK